MFPLALLFAEFFGSSAGVMNSDDFSSVCSPWSCYLTLTACDFCASRWPLPRNRNFVTPVSLSRSWVSYIPSVDPASHCASTSLSLFISPFDGTAVVLCPCACAGVRAGVIPKLCRTVPRFPFLLRIALYLVRFNVYVLAPPTFVEVKIITSLPWRWPQIQRRLISRTQMLCFATDVHVTQITSIAHQPK